LVAEIVGDAFTFTVIVLVAEHPLLLPVTVYVVEVEGLAVTVEEVVLFNPVAGDQVYVVAPDTLSKAEAPLHMLVFGLDVSTGVAVTVTTTVPVVEHPEVVPVTV
jgi:hypothetical protein